MMKRTTPVIKRFAKPVSKLVCDLEPGDLVQDTKLGSMIFARVKRGYRTFVAKRLSTGQNWNIRIRGNYLEARVIVEGFYKAPAVQNDIDTLEVGKLFAFDEGNKLTLFRYMGRTLSGKIKCMHPITDDVWTYPDSFVCLKIENLKN